MDVESIVALTIPFLTPSMRALRTIWPVVMLSILDEPKLNLNEKFGISEPELLARYKKKKHQYIKK